MVSINSSVKLISRNTTTLFGAIQEFAGWIVSIRDVYEENNYVLGMLPGEEQLYLSEDSASKQDRLNSSMENLHSIELLNTILMPGLPNLRLKLKVGILIMLMCNIDKSIKLFNGTQLIVTRLEKHIIGADIMSGAGIGTKVLIPKTTIHHRCIIAIHSVS
ncbi:hypothetical protein K1719_017746 [Acacia pycnantha]|nr:hypothetical protein K1719_017746 [Acacia pycnantha]